MHPSSLIILVILLLQTVSAQPYSLHQSGGSQLADKHPQAIDIITVDNSLMCVAYVFSTWVYTQNSSGFYVSQKFTDLDSPRDCDLTADGKYLLQVGRPNANIYEDLDGDQTFTLMQSLTVPNTDTIGFGSITDDHQWIACSQGWNVYFYKYNGSQYELNHNFQLPGTGEVLSQISQDQTYLLARIPYQNKVKVYKQNGTDYNLIQTIRPPSDYNRVRISADNQYLTISDYYSQHEYVLRYYLDPFTNQFLPFAQNGTIPLSTGIYFATVSQNKQWLFAGAQTNSYLYGGLSGVVSLKQTFAFEGQFHMFSPDSQYLVLLIDESMKIYTLICDVSTEYYDMETDQCKACDNSTDTIDDTGACVYCGVQDLGLTDGECAPCNESIGFELVYGTCLFCGGRAGCETCAYGECLTCYESLDYFLTNTTCEKCQIEGCTDCSGLNTCLTCDEDNDYFLISNGSCAQCQMVGCTDCLDLNTTCLTCNEDSDYFLVSNGSCLYCQVEGCSDCQDVNTCLRCKEDKNYFLENDGQCTLCSIDGCTNCSDLNTCKTCESNYTLENGKCLDVQNVQEEDFPYAVLAVIPVVIIIVGVTVYLCKKKPSVTTVGDEPSKREIGNVGNEDFSYDERFPTSKGQTKILS